MNFVPFLTNKVADPWCLQDEKRFADYGYINCNIRYIPSIHAKLRLIEENMFLCSIKLNNIYKNFHLLPETRNTFYYLAYLPQIGLVHKLKAAGIDPSSISSSSFFYQLLLHYYDYERDSFDMQNDISVIGEHILIKVNAPIKDFYDIFNIGIYNPEIKKKYAELNYLYSHITTEYLSLLHDDYIKKEFLKHNINNIIKRIGIRLVITSILGVAIDNIGDWIDVQDINVDITDDINLEYVSGNYSDELMISGNNAEDFVPQNHISFGKNYHVKQIGGGLGQADVDITKVPGTSSRYNVKFHNKIIAVIDSILPGTRFYVPTIGTCKIV